MPTRLPYTKVYLAALKMGYTRHDLAAMPYGEIVFDLAAANDEETDKPAHKPDVAVRKATQQDIRDMLG